MVSVTRLFQRSVPAAKLLDVRKLIGELSEHDLLAAADGYFSTLTVDSEQCHKPFSNIGDSIHLTRHLSLLLQAADLFHGCDVLDFGCATGWLTMALGDLGSDAVGVDISPSAVALAEQLKAARTIRSGGSARFLVYDGKRLPLDDASVDRIVCFDAFHHVRDQAHVLREFSRILRPGGRVAMVEPGPNHSRTPQSQMEMTKYNVIENDVVLADIAAAAATVGLSSPRMLVQFQKPLSVPFEVFSGWSDAGGLPSQDARRVISGLEAELTDTQSFFMTKGEAPPDSRKPEALAARLELISARPDESDASVFKLEFSIRNTGQAVWLTEPGRRGQVNLGCQLIAADGTVVDLNHGRFVLGTEPVAPSARLLLTVLVQRPAAPAESLRFDLVSEQVAWFGQLASCVPVEWRP